MPFPPVTGPVSSAAGPAGREGVGLAVGLDVELGVELGVDDGLGAAAGLLELQALMSALAASNAAPRDNRP